LSYTKTQGEASYVLAAIIRRQSAEPEK